MQQTKQRANKQKHKEHKQTKQSTNKTKTKNNQLSNKQA